MNGVKHAPQAVVAFIYNRVFCADALFIRAENTVGARERAMVATPASIDAGRHIELRRSILYKGHPQTVVVFIDNRVFCADALFIRTENTVGARSAHVFIARDIA